MREPPGSTLGFEDIVAERSSPDIYASQVTPSQLIKVSLGSNPEVSDGHENVGCWGKSGSRFRAAGLLNLAEAVEEVPGVRIFETMIQNPGRC